MDDSLDLIFSSNHNDPAGREFDLWAVNVDGTGLERITYTEGFDGFPMFSPDGKQLAFGSNRNQAQPGDTDVYVARWVDGPIPEVASAADRILADIAWLADDARGGRGLGTPGLAAAADWLETQFAAIGLEPAAGNGSYRQTFDAVIGVHAGPATALSLNGEDVPEKAYAVQGFSAEGAVSAPVVFAGWGIVSDEHGIDDYQQLDVSGRIVLVRRFSPEGGVFEDEALQRRFGDMRYKAFVARERGAVGLLIADLPENGDQDDAPLPTMRVDTQGDAGIPVAVLERGKAQTLLASGAHAALSVELVEETEQVGNIIGSYLHTTLTTHQHCVTLNTELGLSATPTPCTLSYPSGAHVNCACVLE